MLTFAVVGVPGRPTLREGQGSAEREGDAVAKSAPAREEAR
jgi:hypothetical protein